MRHHATVTWFATVTAGAAAVTAVVLLVRRSSVVPACLLLGAAATLPAVVAAPPAGDLFFSGFLLLTGSGVALPGLLAVLAGYTWLSASVPGRERLVVGSVLGCAVLPGAVASALLFDPVSAGCNACPRDLLELVDAPALSVAGQRFSSVAALACCLLLAGAAVVRWRRGTRLGRRHSALILCSTTGMALVTAVAAVRGLRLPPGALDDVQRRLWLVQCVLLAVLVAGVVTQLVLARAAAARMAGRVTAAIPGPATVQDWLRGAVGDPGLTVTFARDDGVRVDADGVELTGDDSRSAVRLSRDGVIFAEVRSRCRSAQELDLLRTCARSAGLALEYVAARARLRAEARESAVLRSRIVAAGDRERRRLERNLHDGAQQRLVALGVMLASQTRSRPAAEAAAHHAEIDAALAELRTVARGLFPASLGEAGIGAALRELGDHTSAPLLVHDDLVGEVPLPVGMAVYQLVLDAARTAPAESVLRVTLRETDDRRVHVTVVAEGLPTTGAGAAGPSVSTRRLLVRAEDRFLALGGRLDLALRPGALEWEGLVPCG